MRRVSSRHASTEYPFCLPAALAYQVIVGHATYKVIGNQPDRYQVGRGGEGERQFLTGSLRRPLDHFQFARIDIDDQAVYGDFR